VALHDFKWSQRKSPPGGDLKAMPIFEYACKTCNHQFEALVYGGEKAACPKCHGKKLAQQFSVFGVSAKESSGSAPGMGACGSCGDPRGPGSCSRPDMN
jgi:putative FmdB family regulatory protein